MEPILLVLIATLTFFIVPMGMLVGVFTGVKGEEQRVSRIIFLFATVAYAFIYAVYRYFCYELNETPVLFFTIIMYINLFVCSILLFIKIEKNEEVRTKSEPTQRELLRSIKRNLATKTGKTDKYFRDVLEELNEETSEEYIRLYERYQNIKKEEERIEKALYDMKKKHVR